MGFHALREVGVEDNSKATWRNHMKYQRVSLLHKTTKHSSYTYTIDHHHYFLKGLVNFLQYKTL